MACGLCETGSRLVKESSSIGLAILMSWVVSAEENIASTTMYSRVYEIDDAGCRKMGLCFAPVGPLVEGDVMLAQKIALETDERNALTAANKIRITRAWSWGALPP